jgi:hypothetical protein
MVRIRCGQVNRLMAAVTIRGHRGKVIVHMAARARNRRGMETCQRESRIIVIERRGLPHRSCVAERAVGRESNLRVDRSCRALISSQVARNTSGHRQLVVVVDVAARASNRRMKTSQREACCRVIKYRSRPG